MRWLLIPFTLLFLNTKGRFHPHEIYSTIPLSLEDTDSIAPYLDQTFTLFDEGAQVFAFLGEDQETVLKLFKARHMQKWKFKRELFKAFSSRRQRKKRWVEKFEETKGRYELAFEHLKEETALIALHFRATKAPLPTRIRGKQTYQIDLASSPFILQKKVALAPTYVQNHPEKKEEAAKALKAFFQRRLAKGFSDPRQTLSRNYGFLDNRPIQIDVGKISWFEGDEAKELEKIHAHIDEWISQF